MSDTTTDVEPLEAFRERARTYLKENVPPAEQSAGMRGTETDEEELADVARQRKLQRTLFDGGFTGICVPKEYGGQGLPREYQQAFNEEIAGYQFPDRFQVPTMTPCAAVILEFGSEEQKQRHIPEILKGEEIWMQMLSEPSGGSDVAGAQTTAVRDGEEWVLNGSKIWTTGAWWADWALCLTRTNWDVQKHRGLSVFMVKIHQPGIEIHRIEMLNGSKEFCQEFISDVRIPDADRIGDVDDGWTVGTRWMFFERSFAISPLLTQPAGRPRAGRGAGGTSLLRLAEKAGRRDDPIARDLVGEVQALNLAQAALGRRVSQGIMTRKFIDQSASMTRLMSGMNAIRTTSVQFELTGQAGVAWSDDDASIGEHGIGYLTRQAATIGGGTTEMARNVISERVLGMPRERTLDKDVAFRDVPKGPTGK